MTIKEVIVKQLAEKDPEFLLEVLEKSVVEVDGKQFLSLDMVCEHLGVDKHEFVAEAMAYNPPADFEDCDIEG